MEFLLRPATLHVAVGHGIPDGLCHTTRGSAQRNSCLALPLCRGQWTVELLLGTATLQGAVGSGTLAGHCHTAGGRAVGNGTSGRPYHSVAAVGSGAPARHCHTAGGSGTPGGSATLQWAVGRGTLAEH